MKVIDIKFKKDDKVRILRKDITNLLSPYGVVTRQDGHYVYVMPVWEKHEIELYDNEVELAKPFWIGYDKEREKQREETKKIVDECVKKYEHLDNCPITNIRLEQTITDVVVYALWRKEKGWL